MSTTKYEKVTSFLEENRNEVDTDIQEVKCKSPQAGCIREEVEEESTSSFLVGDLRITTQGFGSCMGGEISFRSDPKEKHNSYLQSPLEPHKEEEIEHISVGCEAEKWAGEQATIIPPHKEENITHGELVNSDFYVSLCKSDM